MPTNEAYEQIIAQYDHAGLLELWRAIEGGNTPGWEPGRAFEYLVLRAFDLEGARVRWPYRVERFEQIDGFLYSDGLTCLIESKDQATPLDIGDIAKVRHRLSRRPTVSLGVIFSRTGFTTPVLQQARFFVPQNVILWNGNELGYALERQVMRASLRVKYEYSLEYGFPDQDIMKEDIQ